MDETLEDAVDIIAVALVEDSDSEIFPVGIVSKRQYAHVAVSRLVNLNDQDHRVLLLRYLGLENSIKKDKLESFGSTMKSQFYRGYRFRDDSLRSNRRNYPK